MWVVLKYGQTQKRCSPKADLQGRTYITSVQTLAVWKTCHDQLMMRIDSKRQSRNSVLSARLDGDYIYIYIYIYIYKYSWNSSKVHLRIIIMKFLSCEFFYFILHLLHLFLFTFVILHLLHLFFTKQKITDVKCKTTDVTTIILHQLF